MRYFFTFILLGSFYLANANDTLTRAQVYSFSIGDTFDYRTGDYGYDPYNQYPPSYTVSYSRCIIRNIYSTSDSIYITEDWVYPSPASQYTLQLDSPQKCEVFLDSTGSGFGEGLYDEVIIDSTTLFWSRITNYVNAFQGYYALGQLFAQGLGCVVQTSDGGTGVGGGFDDTTTLIYYSGANGTMGTPYTNFTVGIYALSLGSDIVVYPNPSNGRFYFKGLEIGSTIQVYDLLGQNIYSGIITQDNYLVDLSGKDKGVYFYKVSTTGISEKQGKILLQ